MVVRFADHPLADYNRLSGIQTLDRPLPCLESRPVCDALFCVRDICEHSIRLGYPTDATDLSHYSHYSQLCGQFARWPFKVMNAGRKIGICLNGRLNRKQMGLSRSDFGNL